MNDSQLLPHRCISMAFVLMKKFRPHSRGPESKSKVKFRHMYSEKSPDIFLNGPVTVNPY